MQTDVYLAEWWATDRMSRDAASRRPETTIRCMLPVRRGDRPGCQVAQTSAGSSCRAKRSRPNGSQSRQVAGRCRHLTQPAAGFVSGGVACKLAIASQIASIARHRTSTVFPASTLLLPAQHERSMLVLARPAHNAVVTFNEGYYDTMRPCTQRSRLWRLVSRMLEHVCKA